MRSFVKIYEGNIANLGGCFNSFLVILFTGSINYIISQVPDWVGTLWVQIFNV